MRNRLRSVSKVSRHGFTLIELLLAIAIFAILTTFAISAFTESDQDRSAAGAQQLRSMLEGARSRAIRDDQLRGVRLIRDRANPQTVKSLVYIGAPRIYEGSLSGINYDQGGERTWKFSTNSTNSPWPNLADRNLLVVGLRIEVPAYSGHWFTITDLESSDTRVEVSGHFEPSAWNSTSSDFVVGSSIPLTYRLELAPPILPGSTPVPLAEGIAIDLVPSKLATNWRGSNGTPTSPAGNPYVDLSDDVFAAQMDILFTPRGDVVGAASTAGVLHFVIADVQDIEGGTRFAGGSAGSPPVPPVAYHPLIQNPENPERMVNLFTRTGLVTTSQINRTGFLGSTNIYELSLRGEDAP